MRIGTAGRGAFALALGCVFASAAFAAPAAPSGDGRAELDGDVVEYSVQTGLMTASGHVKLRYEDGVATGDFASYNTKDSTGLLTGGVVADKGELHLDCDRLELLSKTQAVAIGNVHGRQLEKKVDGPRVEYESEKEYVRMPEGGTITTADGTVTADYMEGWLKENRCRGVGNAHIVSPPRDFEGGGDEAEYFGEEKGKLVLTGRAWAVQGNHTLRSARLTVYLRSDGQAEAAAEGSGGE